MAGGETDLNALPAGEREILLLISRQVLMAVCESFIYRETIVKMDCNGAEFTAKGKAVVRMGWRDYTEKEKQVKTLPSLTEGQVLSVSSCEVKEGNTTPPKHFTEDLLLSAMETAGQEDMPRMRKARRLLPLPEQGSLKALSAGLRSEKRKKAVHLIPSAAGVSLTTVLPEQLQSPLLTAEWEPDSKKSTRRNGRECVPCRYL